MVELSRSSRHHPPPLWGSHLLKSTNHFKGTVHDVHALEGRNIWAKGRNYPLPRGYATAIVWCKDFIHFNFMLYFMTGCTLKL